VKFQQHGDNMAAS